MEVERETIAVHNTFTQKWEAEAYFKLAEQYDYEVFIVTAENDFGNTHGVPEEGIARMRERWEPLRSLMLKPQEVSDADIAFPVRALEFMPPMEEIPDEFKENASHPAMGLVRRLLFGPTIPGDVQFHAVEGVDSEMVFRQLMVIRGSFAPKHQHKEAAMAYLISLWLKKVVVLVEDGEDEELWQQPPISS